MADKIEQQNVEVGAWWAVNRIQKEFEIVESKLSKKELTETAKKAEELAELEKKFETKKTDNTWKKIIENNNIAWWYSKQWETFAKENPEKKDRVPAGAEVTKSLDEPQEWNILGKALQWISKRLLWKNNL